MRRDERTGDTKQPAPETRYSACSPADGSREGFGRPALEDGVEHGLEEVFHGIEADVGGVGVDGCVEEEGNCH
jgi:hypothetical protein